jgi:ribosomal protein L17
VSELRTALFAAVSPDDLRQVVESLVEQAKTGNVPAARELLDRCLGRPEALDLLERLEHVEGLLEAVSAARRP